MARRSKSKTIARRGLMLVLSSPSGAGKTTLSRMLLTTERNIELSISVTTRPKRKGEVKSIADVVVVDQQPIRSAPRTTDAAYRF